MLTKRLQKISSVIPRSRIIADVGCDHGYVGIEALTSGVADSVIFVDISNDCLQKARENCPAALKNRADFVCQNGLGNLIVDCAVICGMGGLEIISILNNALTPPLGLVLQPMKNQYETRKYLTENGYAIKSDELFCDGKFYDLIVAYRSQTAEILNEQELTFGKTNLQNPSEDFINFLKKELNKLNGILLCCSDSKALEKRTKVQNALAEALKKER